MYFLSPLTDEPRWRPPGQRWRPSPPVGLRNWLLNTSSLTRRLQTHCAARIGVRVLDQGYRAPSNDERRALGLRPGSWALVRQVRLYCGETPWVFARTVVPPASLRGRARALAHLGNRPLGALLFADPGLRRERPEIALLAAESALYRRATADSTRAGPVWGRRSCFRLQHKPLLVSEFFLPDFVAAMEARGDAVF